jgi:hypothetical protein
LFLSKDDPENEIGASDREPELSYFGAMGLVVVVLLLITLMGGLLCEATGF